MNTFINPSEPYAALRLSARNRGRIAGQQTTARPSAAPKASSAPTVATRPTATAPAGISRAELDKALATARAEERARVAAVFALPSTKGRERQAAEFLAGASSAAEIGKALAMLPSDAERDRRRAEQRQVEAGKAWDHAYAAMGLSKKKAEASDQHGWAKIHDEIRDRRA